MIKWEQPKRARPTAEHYQMHQSDGGVAGTYVKNMSKDDAGRWTGKVVGIKSGSPHVELRKTCYAKSTSACVLIIVSLGGGFNYRYYKRDKTEGVNVHMSMNGALHLTFEELADVVNVVEEAAEKLEELSTP